MGKASQQQLPVVRQQQGAASGDRLFCCRGCSPAVSRIVREFNFKCVFFLILGVAVFMSALFSIVRIHRRNYGYDAKGSIKISATIQGHFILQKPVSELVHYITELEYDIFGEIGVPSTKVVILSMHPANVSNSTNVVFGVLSDPPTVSVNPVFSALLKSTFVELFLQDSNLTLTNSTFGQPSSFEILKFAGGITLIPEQSSPISKIPQILFNFSLNNSVQDIKSNFVELKRQLSLGLDLMPYENVYIQVRNEMGSTIDPPTLVEASITSYSGGLSLWRLKELADKVVASSPSNLGLSKITFGKVKEVKLSSSLNCSLWDLPPAPSPSPLPAPAPSPSPTYPVSDPPAPAPCSNNDTFAPSDPINAYSPSPQDDQDHNCSPSLPSPAPSEIPPAPSVSYVCDNGCGNVNEKIVEPPPYALPLSSAPSSLGCLDKIWWLSLFCSLIASQLLSGTS